MILTLLFALVAADVSGTVFLDHNANGRRDAGEPGLAGVVVSDQVQVVTTDSAGVFRIAGSRGFGVVFVSVPDGYRPAGGFWQPAGEQLAFGLTRAPANDAVTFVHASDTHISPASVAQMRRFRAMIDSIRPDFVIVTGDLVRDALRVGEAEATGYYELFEAEAARFAAPLFTVPGNHEIFGIERARSNVRADHPLYGRAMYRRYRGPDYYSFNAGGIHFVGLNSIDVDDQWYYGHIDSVQLAWLARDLAAIPADMPVVTFNHIPFFTAVETINGFMDTPPAPSTITIGGRTQFRHNVSNASEVLGRIRPHPFPLALGGHMHVRERLRYEGAETRFDQAAAIIGPSRGAGLTFTPGVTVYTVRAATIGEGTFVPLGAALP